MNGTPEEILSSLLKGIDSQIAAHLPVFNESVANEAAEYNELVSLLESRDKEILRKSEEITSLIKQRDLSVEEIQKLKNFIKQMEKAAEEVQKISRNTNSENIRLNNELKELRALNPKKLKEQVRRLKESIKKYDAKIHGQHHDIAKERRKVLHAEQQYTEVADKYNNAVETMRRMHEMMKLEGALCEREMQDENGNWFFIYRKPTTQDTRYRGNCADDPIVNRDFYFEIQTDRGISFHVLQLESGDIGYPNVGIIVPDEIDQYCRDEYAKTEEYTAPKVVTRVGAQSELDKLIAEIENL
ncbi:hypothetical protein VME_45860 [Vibrio harveyi 1DA3]|nr:hypothetical protein VME_45860 [Vibrio harveyi 1DA3]